MKLKKNLFVIEGAAKIGVVFFQVKDYEIIKNKVFLGAPVQYLSIFKSSAFVIGAAVNLARAKIVQKFPFASLMSDKKNNDNSRRVSFQFPAGNHMFKVNNRNNRTRCELRLKLTTKTQRRRQWRRSGVSIVNF